MIGNNGRVHGRQVVPSRMLASLRESAGNNAIASKGNVERLTLHQGMTYKSY